MKASNSHQLTALQATAEKDQAAVKTSLEKKLAAVQVLMGLNHKQQSPVCCALLGASVQQEWYKHV